jgi:uncharacterized protein
MTSPTSPDASTSDASTRSGNYDRNGLEILGHDACMALLKGQYVGRLAFVQAGEPTILPVNYTVFGDSIVFRTSFGGKLDAAGHVRPAAFEVDDIDETYQRGWSVLVKGTLYDVTDRETLDQLEELPLRPWVRHVEHPFWVRLVPNEVTGRRIVI